MVIENFLGQSLERARAYIVPIRGGKQAQSALSARFLFDFTSAAFLLVLDNLENATVREVWAAAQGQVRAGDDRAARRALRRLEDIPGGEARC